MTAAEPWGASGVGPANWTSSDEGIKAYVEQDQSFDVNNDWPQKVSAAGSIVSDATLALLRQRQGAANSDDPFKLANFLKKGGKVILYHGGSDPRISTFRTKWYYEQLASLRGGYSRTQESVRLFIVPGMGHCGGGVAPNSFDTLQALHNWVTKKPRSRGGSSRRPPTVERCRSASSRRRRDIWARAMSTSPPTGPAMRTTRACCGSEATALGQARIPRRRCSTSTKT
jgi:hypothetical protein